MIGPVVPVPFTLPWLTTEQMIEVDRLMVEEFHIGLAQMMESAGRGLAHLARVRFLDDDPSDRRVVVLAGTGGGRSTLAVAHRVDDRVDRWPCVGALGQPDPSHASVAADDRVGAELAGVLGRGAAAGRTSQSCRGTTPCGSSRGPHRGARTGRGRLR